MISFYVFTTNMIFHHRQQTNENQARELCTKCTFTRKKNNNKNNRKEKTEKFVFQMKKEKKEVSPWNYLKYRDNFNITPTGVGLLPTHHDKNNERSSGIRPLGL